MRERTERKTQQTAQQQAVPYDVPVESVVNFSDIEPADY
jgi:hypothetical protein